jgi:preprotein translocase subunit Sec63
VPALRDEPLDLYALLEVSPQASQEVIQAAYRVLARRFHPDRDATAEAARRMRQINAAYRVIGSPAPRASYDLERARERRRTSVVLAGSKPRPAVTVTSSGHSDGLLLSQTRQVVLLLVLIAAVAALLVLLVWISLDGSGDVSLHQVDRLTEIRWR